MKLSSAARIATKAIENLPKALAKFAQLDDRKMVEATWQEYAAHLQKFRDRH
jgi:hypothetical protein